MEFVCPVKIDEKKKNCKQETKIAIFNGKIGSIFYCQLIFENL